MFTLTPYEIYIFILCAIVFVALTTLFTVMVVYIVRLMVKLIRNGVEDERIWREYLENKGKKDRFAVVDRILTVISCCVLFVVFGCAVYMQVFSDSVTGNIPLYRVVLSGSMSQKDEGNEYLFENDLNDQFDRFDLILTHKLPDEFDLELYDVVVYEVDGTLIVHRIVEIQEPNEHHPNERYFRFQGDNVDYADKFPVKYEQMKAIYKGERIRFIGSFFAFMQSPAGYLCVLLLLLGIIAIPLMEKKIEEEELKRLRFLMIQYGELDEEEVNPLAAPWVRNANVNDEQFPFLLGTSLGNKADTLSTQYLSVAAAGGTLVPDDDTEKARKELSEMDKMLARLEKKRAKRKGKRYNLYEMLRLNHKNNRFSLHEKEYWVYVQKGKGKNEMKNCEVSFVLRNSK